MAGQDAAAPTGSRVRYAEGQQDLPACRLNKAKTIIIGVFALVKGIRRTLPDVDFAGVFPVWTLLFTLIDFVKLSWGKCKAN